MQNCAQWDSNKHGARIFASTAFAPVRICHQYARDINMEDPRVRDKIYTNAPKTSKTCDFHRTREYMISLVENRA